MQRLCKGFWDFKYRVDKLMLTTFSHYIIMRRWLITKEMEATEFAYQWECKWSVDSLLVCEWKERFARFMNSQERKRIRVNYSGSDEAEDRTTFRFGRSDPIWVCIGLQVCWIVCERRSAQGLYMSLSNSEIRIVQICEAFNESSHVTSACFSCSTTCIDF
jgi:hypothetical protein